MCVGVMVAVCDGLMRLMILCLMHASYDACISAHVRLCDVRFGSKIIWLKDFMMI